MSVDTNTPQIVTSHRGINYVAISLDDGWRVQSRRQNALAAGAIRRYATWDKLAAAIPAFRRARGVH